MAWWKQHRWLVAAGIGLIVGLALGGVWPHTPLYAVATDRVDTFAMATGLLDTQNQVEAVYFLDFLTGQLTAVVPGKLPGTWTGYFQRNVAADLSIDPAKSPKYLMTTGLANLRRSGGTREQPSITMCYVAEISSGKVAQYAVPWMPSMYAAGQPQNQELYLVGVTPFRRPMGATGGR
jgi:hypothetical protein